MNNGNRCEPGVDCSPDRLSQSFSARGGWLMLRKKRGESTRF